MGGHRPPAALEACSLMGTPADMVERLGRLRRAGVTDFILGPLVADAAQVDLIDGLVARPLAAREA
jgi:alkanesulfonate monooxygenase SsuD/methylene tetrahydromethanopterin reductase-like flavin-dependent oxidoreductase (luciferase family)